MITVITPVFNNVDTISDCINSIQCQTVSCQHIVIDGGSSDGTLDIIRDQSTQDTKLISEPDRGMYDAINKGIRLSTGDVIGILNADDFFSSHQVLERILAIFTESTTDATYGDLIYVDRQKPQKRVRTWRAGDYKRERFYNGWMPPHPTFYLRRHWYQKFGGYRLDLGTAADYELMLRVLVKYNAQATYIPSTLVNMRTQGMSNANLRSRILANRNDRHAWRVNDMSPRAWTILAKPLRKTVQWFYR